MSTESDSTAQQRELAEVERDYPPWETWRGVLGGILYARRPNSSPPMVVRAVSTGELRTAIEAAEVERGIIR